MPRRYVLTGAPGAGKTALAVTLRQRGYLVVAEAATDLIANEQARGVNKPWRAVDFLDNIARLQRQRQLSQIADPSKSRSMTAHRCAPGPGPLSAAAGHTLAHRRVTRVIDNQIYQRAVFFVRPLGFITPTHVRRISYPDSLRFEAIHEAV
jgi:predicted ATPase